jgi:hypothetical protein
MAQIHGPTVDDRGQYHAVELMGHNMVRLVRVGTLPEPNSEVWRIRIPKVLARKAGAKRLKGESLDACIARLLEQAL